jgi:hydroxymethylglutaryl-CoA reductase
MNMEVKGFNGFSKLSKEEKLHVVANYFSNPDEVESELKGFDHKDKEIQKLFDEFSENTISNFILPFSVAPNFKINNKMYTVPMVIEESSVVAAASNAAKFWIDRGGFKAEIIGMDKVGQVHFYWNGEESKLKANFEELKKLLFQETEHITASMQKRGGGIKSIELVCLTDKDPGYFQIKAIFDTVDSMGANFINSCLEEFAAILKHWLSTSSLFNNEERDVHVVMSILSNYTPNCLVRCWVECPIEDLGVINGVEPKDFVWKFEKAMKVAHLDVNRATTHNKGIYNGIDAVVLASGNDFRAVEACGHTYASRDGQYRSLTNVSTDNGNFKFWLDIPMALGVVGGLTNLHPLVKRALELLGNPSAKELMMIAAAAGLANNFGAIKSLTTTGIQQGHMKMHLLNIMNHFNASQEEKDASVEFFSDKLVSFSGVREFIDQYRESKQVKVKN